MTTLPNYTPFYGGGQVQNPANVLRVLGAPSTVLTEDRIGTIAIDPTNQNAYILEAKSGGVNTWALISGSASLVELTGDTGTATPTAGFIKLAGTTNEITTAAAGTSVTFTIPTVFVAPGSIRATTTLTATLGNITATNGNLSLATAGNKILIGTGANASVGTTAAMSGTPGSVSVASTAITINSFIMYARDVAGGTLGQVSVSAQSAGNFTLLSTGNETSTFSYLIIN